MFSCSSASRVDSETELVDIELSSLGQVREPERDDRWIVGHRSSISTYQMLGGLAVGEAGKLFAMIVGEVADEIRFDPGVFAQRPADCLADKELLFVGPAQTEVGQHRPVCLVFVPELAQDRGPTQPHVRMLDPSLEHWSHSCPIVQDNSTDEVGRNLIDEVPPRAFADQPFVQVDLVEGDECTERLGVTDREILLLPVRERPESEDISSIFVCIARERSVP